VQWLTHLNDRQQQNVNDLVVKPFEAANAGLKLKIIIWQGDRREYTMTLIAGGQTPDVSWLTDPALIALDIMQDITALVARDKVDLSPFPKAAFDAWFRDRKGALYALPNQSGGDWAVMPTNKRMYEEAGLNLPPVKWQDASWNWERFVTDMKKLTKTAGGKVTQFGWADPSTVYLFIDWPNLFDTSWLAPDGRTVMSDRAELIEAYERYFALVHQERVVSKPGELKELFGIASSRDGFLQEKAAIFTTSPGGLFPVIDAVKQGAPFVYSPIPRGTSKEPVSNLNLDGNGIFKGAKQPDGGWALVQWGASTINWAISRAAGFHRVDFFEQWADAIYGPKDLQQKIRIDAYREALQWARAADPVFSLAAYNQIRDKLVLPAFDAIYAGKATVRETFRNIKQPMQAMIDESLKK